MKSLDDNKENVILINKADLLTAEQRSGWAEFFEKENVKVIFWSALAEAIQVTGDSKVTWADFSGWVSVSGQCAVFVFFVSWIHGGLFIYLFFP